LENNSESNIGSHFPSGRRLVTVTRQPVLVGCGISSSEGLLDSSSVSSNSSLDKTVASSEV
jgi:hypothetical protein